MPASERRRWAATVPVIGVVLLALLAVSALPVAALQTNTAVGGIHDDPSDFETNSTLENTSVRGTDAGAVVQYSPGLIDGFEDGDGNVETDGFSGYSSTGFGSVPTFNVQSDFVINGTQSANVTSNGQNFRWQFSADHNRTDDFTTYALQNNVTGGGDNLFYRFEDADGERILGVFFRHNDGRIDINGDSTVDAGPWSPNSIYNITIDWDFANDQATVHINGTSNTVNLQRSADGWAIVKTGLDMDNTGFSNTATFDNHEFEVPSGTPGTYISGNLSVSNASTGFTNVSALSDMEAIVTWQVSDGGPWMDFATATHATPGNKTVDLSAATNSTFRVNVTYNPTGANPVGRMGDDGILFTNHEPQVKNSTASPTGELSATDPTISIQINDTEFGTVQGDSVEATLRLDGVIVGSDTLSNNGTASVAVSGLTGGSHTYQWTVNDSFGGQNQSQSFSISTPANITIRNESEPHEIIKNADVEIIISGDQDTVDKRTVTNGNISLTGLPLDEEYIVIVDAPTYHQRSIFVPDVFEQSDVFLLNETLDSRENEFQIEDRTGLFGEPVLEIQRGINKSLYDPDADPKYQWLTIAGDRLGASETYTTDLEYQARYRLVVRQGENTRVLGEHTVEADGTVPLPIGQIEWSMPENEQYNWTFRRVDHPTSGSGEAVRFALNDTTDSTSEIRGVIHEAGNESNVLTTFSSSGTAGTYSLTQPLSTDEANVTWQLEWNATREDERIGSTGLDDFQRLDPSVPLFSAIQSLDPQWRSAITLVVIIGVGFIYSGLFASVGALLIVAAAVVLWFVGLSTIGLGITTLALVISIAYRLAERGGP